LAPSVGTTSDLTRRLLARRNFECRLTPDRALETVEQARLFLADRGMLTLMPDSSLPSLFGACHEEPYMPGRGGFANWPRTKYRWADQMGGLPDICSSRLHRGARLYLSRACAALADPLCRVALAAAEGGSQGPLGARLLEYLAQAGPSTVEDVAREIGADGKSVRKVRDRLEAVGALLAEAIVVRKRLGPGPPPHQPSVPLGPGPGESAPGWRPGRAGGGRGQGGGGRSGARDRPLVRLASALGNRR
jgi:hypothetical protein